MTKFKTKDELKISNAHIAHAVRIAMAIEGVNIKELSEKSGFSHSGLTRFLGESTNVSDTKLSTVYALATALGLTTDELWTLPERSADILTKKGSSNE